MPNLVHAYAFETTGVTVGTAASTLVTWTTATPGFTMDALHGWVTFEVSNTGATALNAFAVQNLAHTSATWVDYLAQWTTPDDVLTQASSNIATLAGSATATATIRVYGADQLRFAATVAVGSTTCDIRGNFVVPFIGIDGQ